jgi:hypothetical protein
MKKQILSLAISLIIASMAHAQLSVLSNGNVGVAQSNPNYNLQVSGTVGLGPTSWPGWNGAVKIDWTNSWGAPVLYSSQDLGMDIGKPAYRINSVYAYQYYTTNGYLLNNYNFSDRRLKKDIKNITSPLIQIKKLQGVSYHLNSNSLHKLLPKINTNSGDILNYGFIAQDIQKVFPELVKQADSVTSYLAVNYVALIPLIVEAMKEQSSTIDSLKSQNKILTGQVANIQNCCNNNKGGGSLKSDAIGDAETTNQTATIGTPSATKLYQNAPNPFKESTTIKLEIPETIGNAMVCIYDLNGRQLKCLSVSGRGTTSVQIYGNELTAGLYHYALIADGALIDTKTMVLTN